MDVREVVKTVHKTKLMHDLFFRKQGRQLVRLQRRNLLEFGGSDSRDSSSNSDPAVQTKYLNSLVGWTAKTPVEKKLVLGVLHRSGHKDFEEAGENQIANLNQRKKSIMSLHRKSIMTNPKSLKSNKLSLKQEQQESGPSETSPFKFKKAREDVDEVSSSSSDPHSALQ